MVVAVGLEQPLLIRARDVNSVQLHPHSAVWQVGVMSDLSLPVAYNLSTTGAKQHVTFYLEPVYSGSVL